MSGGPKEIEVLLNPSLKNSLPVDRTAWWTAPLRCSGCALVSGERGTRSTNASVLTSRWSRGETGRQQRDTWTPLASRLLTIALCLCLPPADMASSPCRLCLRPTGGCGWRLWMGKSLYDYSHLLITLITFNAPAQHVSRLSLKMGPNSFSCSADLHAAIFAQQKRGE